MLSPAPREPETTVLTGATGFVGSHFVFHALRTRDTRIVAIVRARDPEAGRARLAPLLLNVAASYHEPLTDSMLARLDVLCGDLELPRCGVDADALHQLADRGVDSFWHFAASLCFEERNRESIERLNVQGTQHALDLADALGAGRYNQVSTAYTCGQQTGSIGEDLHNPDGPFNNHYERTKCRGEHMAAEACQRRHRPYGILRPSIVVGPERTHLPGGSDSGLYGFSREIHRLRRTLRSIEDELMLKGEPQAEVNFIPVDRLVHDMWALHDGDYPTGPVYHLTSDSSPTVAETMSAVAQGCGVCPIVVCETGRSTPSPVERLFERRTDFYASYLKHAKRFARAWGERTVVSKEAVADYVSRYLTTRGRQDPLAPFRRRSLALEDGFTLCTYEAGNVDGPTLVLANAYGMPVDVFVPLARALAPSHRIITWESRGVPSTSGDLDHDNCGLDAHASDLAQVMDLYGVPRAHLVGFCTGADVAVHFAARCRERVMSLCVANGALWAEDAPRTAFQQNLEKVMPACARSQAHARLYHGLIFGGHSAGTTESDRGAWNALLDSLDAGLSHITSTPFRSPELLHRYAVMMGRYREDTLGSPPQVDLPMLVLTAKDDPITHPGASAALAQRTPGAELRHLDGTGHFGLYLEPRAWEWISEFVRKAPRPTTLRDGTGEHNRLHV